MMGGGVFIGGSALGLVLGRASPEANGLEAWRPLPKGTAQMQGLGVSRATP